MAAQSAKAWGRLKNRREVEVALDKGRSILEALPRPSNPDHHFQIDPAKWHFYEMDAYRLVGENPLATTYAEEVLRIGTAVTGKSAVPCAMRRHASPSASSQLAQVTLTLRSSTGKPRCKETAVRFPCC